MSTGNLPDWPGAATVYSRCALITAHMARAGHVTVNRFRTRTWCTVSAELESLISAMNRGDENAMKAAIGANLAIVFPESR